MITILIKRIFSIFKFRVNLLKTFLLIFIFALSLNADSSYQSKCVKDFYLTSSGTTNRINIFYSHTPSTVNVYTYSTSIVNELVNNIDKFSFDSTTSRCNPIFLDDSYYGLSQKDFNYSMAIYGVFLSSLIAYGLIKAF